MSRSLMVVAVLAAVAGGPAAIAQENARIGFVNTDRMLREAAPAKTAQTKLEQEFSRREKEIDDAGATLKTASERFEREAPTLSESQRQNRQRQLMDQDREFLKVGGVFSDDLIDAYIRLKMEDVTRVRMTTHPVEFDLYYSL